MLRVQEVSELPTDKNELSERKKLILKAIIDTHINMGEPVGSKYLTRYEQLAFSSATIRNEMAELEEMGYLEQPHTSAGRIPSQLGYRFYVDQLMQQYRMTSAELGELDKLMKLKAAELDRVLDKATKLMSTLTNYTGVALKRSQRQPTIARFDVMYLSSRSVILVMLADTGAVKTRQLRFGFDVSRETAEKLAAILNEYVAGREMDKITLPVMLEMQSKLGGAELISPIVKAVWDTVNEPDDSELMFDGVNNLLSYPEYSNIDAVRDVLGMFDEKDELLDVMSKDAGSDKMNIYIGSESPVEVMNNSSLIFRTVKSGDQVVGAIGVIGPRRMDYSKVVTLVDYMSKNISKLMDSEGLIEGRKSSSETKEE